jgi:SAM-dependent methyltransferase
MPSHSDRILDQFTRQAVPFAGSASIRNEEALNRIVEWAGAGPEDTVLDVACGPGLLICAFARVAKHATGVDMTPAMLEQARKLQKEKGLTNVSWQSGDVYALPFPQPQFSIVSSRFAFHHFQTPLAALKEMKRVCLPEGRIVVADMAPLPEKAATHRTPALCRCKSCASCLNKLVCPIRKSTTIAWKARWKSCWRALSPMKAVPTVCAKFLLTHWPTTPLTSIRGRKMGKFITAFRLLCWWRRKAISSWPLGNCTA